MAVNNERLLSLNFPTGNYSRQFTIRFCIVSD